ncbi:TOBE domain-containing protein [Amycolatopsis sp. NPDC089917]|uniref:TOBE domain-containing protein n=1 Tax=Amycolatopsis sp. NPDC089917 TaxID=3155187 RepID=UPI00344814CA
MGLSIRNQLTATVLAITSGEAMATVKARLSGGREITAAITREAVEDLALAEGSEVRVLVKSTEVSLATGEIDGISIRNQLPGTVAGIAAGGAMAAVKVAVDGGELTAAVTKEAVDELGLSTGTPVVALVKSTEISLATA